ncbi:MAG: tetratricopeptide repeat protein, partial [Kiritimatiellia bacterium]
MNWNIFEYAGRTALAWAALMASLAVLLAILGASGYLLWRRRWVWGAFPLPLLAVWGVCWGFFGPKLDHAWLYLQENANRAYSTYVGLTFATAFLPPNGGEGRGAFLHIATRDSGFAKGRPVAVERTGGHVLARYEDEDYPGGVTTLDGRPVDTGYRFRGARLLVSLIPLFEMPSAKTFRVEGEEAAFYAPPLSEAGLREQAKGAPADIVLVAPGPDWEAGADTPAVADWRRIAEGLSRDGVAALHLDARLLSRARLKRILADFRVVFTHYRLWCTGRHRYVLTSGGTVLADEALELFAAEKPAAAFVAADAISPAEVFACYLGTDFEVEPGLLDAPAFGRARAVWSAPKLAFAPPPTNHLAEVRAAAITPLDVPFPDWFARGTVDGEIYSLLTNGVMRAQVARREILMGFDAADRGAATNALDHWAAAAKINPRDPLLRGLADSLDLEGRRFLRIGNVNAAIHCYENRLLIRPQDVAAVHNFGVCLKKSGHLDMAASVFAKAVTMDPRTDEHRLELVECCASIHKEDVACRQLDVLMKRHPDDPALKMRAAKLLCLKANAARDETRAIALAEEAVRLTGWKDRSYVHALADVYIESGRVLM